MKKKSLVSLVIGLFALLGFSCLNTKSVKSTFAASDETEYQLITSTDDLEAGKSYVITNGTSGSCKAIGVDSNTNNRKSASVTIKDNKFVRGNSVLSLTLGGDSNGWTFATENYKGTAGYFNATNTTGSNYLKIEKSLDAFAYFSISFDSNKAVITCTGKTSRNIMRYNTSDLFSCYSSGQSPIYLFKEINKTPTIEFEDEFLYKHVSVGDTFQYKVKTENIGDAQVTFSSDNEDAATIDSTSGVVNCLSVNVVNITASVIVEGVTYSATTELWISFAEPEAYKNASIQDVIDSDEYNSRAFELEVTIKGWGIDGTDASPNDYGDMLVTDGNNDFPIYGLSNIPTDLEWDGYSCNYTTSRRNTFNTASPTNLLTIGSIIPVKGFKVNKDSYQALSCVLIGTPTINELKSISITPVGNKEYNVGDSVSPEDFSASVTHSLTGNESISSSDCTISPETFTTGGDAVPVTVSYTDRSGTISNTYYVKVNVPEIDIEVITIDEKDGYIRIPSNSTYQMHYSYEPQNQNETIVWESDNPEIATVDANGLVTPVSKGITIITASGNRSGELDMCMVEVVYTPTVQTIVSDVIDLTTAKLKGTSGYKDVTFDGPNSGVEYSGKLMSATGSNAGSIQINYTYKDTSGLFVKGSNDLVFDSISFDYKIEPTVPMEVYGSHDPFELNSNLEELECVGSIVGNGTIYNSNENYEYFYLKATKVLYLNSITINWKKEYKATLEDMDLLNTFVDLYLGPEVAGEYNSITNKGTGLCISEGLYADAKNEFNNTLSDEQRAIFTQDDYFAEPRERLLAWAKANNDSLDSKTYLLSARQRIGGNDFAIFNSEEDSTVLILIISMSAMFSIGILYILKKKKEN